MTAKLFASTVSSNTTSAFEWILEVVGASTVSEMTSELEIAKAIQHLKTKEFAKVILQFLRLSSPSFEPSGHRNTESF